MAALFPYTATPGNQIHVYMPQTPHISLLENDGDHSILACFLHTATNRNPTIIQHRLVELFGGNTWDYPILAISSSTFLVTLPEYLDRNQILQELLLWSVVNHIHIWRWDHEHAWNPTPPGFKVYLEVRNYPAALWYPHLFHLLTSDFGIPLYVDDANTVGIDRSTLRITISWHSATGGPRRSIIRGRLILVDWPRDPSTYDHHEDQQIREALSTAHEAAIRQSREGSPDGDGYLDWNHLHRQGLLAYNHGPSPSGAPHNNQNPKRTTQERTVNPSVPPLQPANSAVQKRLQYDRYLLPPSHIPKTLQPNLYLGHSKHKPIHTLNPIHHLPQTTLNPLILTARPPHSSKACTRTLQKMPASALPFVLQKNQTFSHLSMFAVVTTSTYNKTNSLFTTNVPTKPLPTFPAIPQTKSILGPHPSTYKYQPQSLIALSTNHARPTMDPSDEALIRKFAGLITRDDTQPRAVVLQHGAAITQDWNLCLRVKVLSYRMIFANQFEKHMRRAWDVKRTASFSQKDKGVFLVQCSELDEKKWILNEGPWVYRGLGNQGVKEEESLGASFHFYIFDLAGSHL
ncbi:hypothetical protein FCM35_KLT01127 [Carex littledalei]|uniref:DUF4283 domain-containing protein n=1 Tax=Carex littledalei TaxID=544730 RepID=A0A833R5B7_9POAL|nr:hypothetical protein FCM35_KLT01127 [Carex littledalei]